MAKRPVVRTAASGVARPVRRASLPTRIARLPRTLRARLSTVAAFQSLVGAAHESLDPRRVAEEIVARVADWLPMASWAVLVDDWIGQPHLAASRGLVPAWRPVAETVAARVVRTGRDWTSGDVRRDHPDAPALAVLAFPLASRGQLRAALVGFDPGPVAGRLAIGARARRGLDVGFGPLAHALDSALRVQRAEALSVTDDLTQLYNSRYLQQVLHRETKRTARTRLPVSLLFIDLDGFKVVNDTHGHLAGSLALVEVAQVLRQSARETDVVSRYGGDEFAVVLPETDARGARAVASRIQQRIATQSFLESEGLQVRLTVSIGVSTLKSGAVSADALLRAADEAMYWIKERGKNGIHAIGTRGRPVRLGADGRGARR
jgi:diguanylate cyclase (GGDEF)-like protein